MPIHKSYSVSRLLTAFLILLFLATVLLSVFYFISFTQITYNLIIWTFSKQAQKRREPVHELILAHSSWSGLPKYRKRILLDD